jgi:plasmid stabilization system protein ParE
MQIHKITYEPEALANIAEIEQWYEAVKNGLGEDFRKELIEKIEKYLTKFPKIFQIAYKNRRVLLLNRFPHKVVFIIDENKNEIQILAVIHPKRNIEI